MSARRPPWPPRRPDGGLSFLEVAQRRAGAASWEWREPMRRCSSCTLYFTPTTLISTEITLCSECRYRGRPAEPGDPYDDLGGSG